MQLKKTLLYVAGIALAFSACQNQHADLAQAPKSGNPFNYDSLSYDRAKRYVKNYEKHVSDLDSVYVVDGKRTVKKKPNSRSIWFDINRLQSMIDKIKAEGGDGIRFYMATYDSVYNDKILGGNVPPKIYWGYNTLIMVSTKDSTNKAEEKFHRDYFTSGPVKPNAPTVGFIVGNPPENRGEICPPPVKCNAIGALLIP